MNFSGKPGGWQEIGWRFLTILYIDSTVQVELGSGLSLARIKKSSEGLFGMKHMSEDAVTKLKIHSLQLSMT